MRRRAAVFTSAVAIVIAGMTLVPHLMGGNLLGGANPDSKAGSHQASELSCQAGYSYGYDGSNHETFIVLNVERFAIVIGQTDRVFGRLFNRCPGRDPLPLRGQKIHLDTRLITANRWNEFATLTTGDDGGFSLHVSPDRNHVYRARFLGSSASRPSVAPYSESTSNWETVAVRVGISIQPLNAKTSRNLAITFTGKVVPNKSGKKIWLQLWDRGRHAWRTVARNVPLDSNSHYAVGFISRIMGKFYFRTVYPTQDHFNLWNMSQVATGTWK